MTPRTGHRHCVAGRKLRSVPGHPALTIEDAPNLLMVEAELPDGVVLVLQGHVLLADELRGVAVVFELVHETRLRRPQVKFSCWLLCSTTLTRSGMDNDRSATDHVRAGKRDSRNNA